MQSEIKLFQVYGLVYGLVVSAFDSSNKKSNLQAISGT